MKSRNNKLCNQFYCLCAAQIYLGQTTKIGDETMTASEKLLTFGHSVWIYLAGLSPLAFAMNICLTVALPLLFWVGTRLITAGLRFAVHRVPGPPSAEKKVRTSRAMRFSNQVLKVVLGAGLLFLLPGIWGLDLTPWFAGGLGQQAVQVIAGLSLLLIGAVVALEISALLINHAMGRLRAQAAPRRAKQLDTLGPIVRSGVQIAIGIVVFLTMFGQLGVQIGPLIAGAGVAGVAIGFGAQTLVKDFLTGFFLIIEDIVAVGDIVRVGDSGGQVEEMTLRTIRLRDFDGTLHVFPYSEAQIIHNLTKTFSYYVFDLQVSYESNLDRAMDVMRETGAALQREAEFGDAILEPLEVVGVDNLGDSGVVLKARIKTLPIQQWRIGREFNRRIKLAFDAAGIDIPYPHMRVVMPKTDRHSKEEALA
ncbi:mechanosensitive ion channel family protein [Asticcacaulis sp. AC466]|uniref:mechanosensitive ion channel family protein n=1 Tax=Asticcacaulis sp. AC466 TaxID=1282362 RepID=UPI001F414FEE|nr:mechanosensitive ion channel family protein [Asticcacaulis sp. AC466]